MAGRVTSGKPATRAEPNQPISNQSWLMTAMRASSEFLKHVELKIRNNDSRHDLLMMTHGSLTNQQYRADGRQCRPQKSLEPPDTDAGQVFIACHMIDNGDILWFSVIATFFTLAALGPRFKAMDGFLWINVSYIYMCWFVWRQVQLSQNSVIVLKPVHLEVVNRKYANHLGTTKTETNVHFRSP